jgi:hypothetical protein
MAKLHEMQIGVIIGVMTLRFAQLHKYPWLPLAHIGVWISLSLSFLCDN